MKLDKIAYPYSDLYTTGYLCKDKKSGRNMLILIGPEGRLTTAYARYLVAVKLGRFLEADETVDHIDENPSNDTIDNLQILSLRDNIQKAPHRRVETHGTYAMYKHGCRCDECLASEHARQKRYRDSHPDKIRLYKQRARRKLMAQ